MCLEVVEVEAIDVGGPHLVEDHEQQVVGLRRRHGWRCRRLGTAGQSNDNRDRNGEWTIREPGQWQRPRWTTYLLY
jgi:hypothetical protein